MKPQQTNGALETSLALASETWFSPPYTHTHTAAGWRNHRPRSHGDHVCGSGSHTHTHVHTHGCESGRNQAGGGGDTYRVSQVDGAPEFTQQLHHLCVSTGGWGQTGDSQRDRKVGLFPKAEWCCSPAWWRAVLPDTSTASTGLLL